MKTKALVVYIALGIAFAAVSLWVILSYGSKAKAIRTKYRLGGAMIAAWAILSAANCQGPGLFGGVECYDPIPPQNDVYVEAKELNASTLKCGDVISVMVLSPTYTEYEVTITTKEEEPELLQSQSYVHNVEELGDGKVITYEITIVETEYKGTVDVKVYGIDAQKNKIFVGESTMTLH